MVRADSRTIDFVLPIGIGEQVVAVCIIISQRLIFGTVQEVFVRIAEQVLDIVHISRSVQNIYRILYFTKRYISIVGNFGF